MSEIVKKWFVEMFAVVLADGTSSSVVLRQLFDGNGKHFDCDCSVLVGRLQKMRLVFNFLRADNYKALCEPMEVLVKSLTRSVYQTDVFSIDGHTAKFKIKVTENRDGGKLVGFYFHIIINNVVSNFAKFSYEFSDKKFYWILDTEWFRTWCEKESIKMIEAGVKPVEIVKQIVTVPVPVNDVVSQLNTSEDVKVIVEALKAGKKKIWYWVGVNPLKMSDPNYASAWERVAGGPTTSEDTAIEWAEEHQGSVFVSTKKSDLWGNVVARGEYYSSVPF